MKPALMRIRPQGIPAKLRPEKRIRARFLAAMKMTAAQIVGPTLASARPGQALALQALSSCTVVRRMIMKSALMRIRPQAILTMA